jgi:hypothetical protein
MRGSALRVDAAGVQNAPSAAVVACAGHLAVNVFSKPDLNMLFLRAGLDKFAPGERYSKSELVNAGISPALRKRTDPAVGKGLWTFVELVAQRLAFQADGEVNPGEPLWQLREAQRSDGLDLAVDDGVGSEPFEVRLLPMDDPAAPLSRQITALEADFDRLGMTAAATHYEQAVDNFRDQNFEAANGQLRSMFEAVVVHTARRFGFTSTRAGSGGAAINYLRTHDHLPDDDGGMFVHGLWKIVHTNGPHPGTTTAGETHFRLLTLTGAARYLIDRFAPPN